ncbi:MAG: hypothetical protein QXL94_02935 [Candidatus Parvarchaeum sp.]
MITAYYVTCDNCNVAFYPKELEIVFINDVDVEYWCPECVCDFSGVCNGCHRQCLTELLDDDYLCSGCTEAEKRTEELLLNAIKIVNRFEVLPDRFNTERYDVTVDDLVPVGVREEIIKLLKAYVDIWRAEVSLSSMVDAVNAIDWHNNSESGSLVKRIGKVFYKITGASLKDYMRDSIGNMVKDYTKLDYCITFDRNVKLEAKDFYNEDSCWWGEYRISRRTFAELGGIGMLDLDLDGTILGRVWLIALDSHYKPLLGDIVEAEHYLLFNGYGTLGTDKAAMVVSTLFNAPHYGKGTFINEDKDIYINGHQGMLVSKSPMMYCTIDLKSSFTFMQHKTLS